MKKIVAPVLISAALLVGLATSADAALPERNGNTPLTTYAGSYRVVDETGESGPPSDWDYVSASHHAAMTLSPGLSVEVRWGGWCTDPHTGKVHRSRLFHHAKCTG